MDHMKNNEFSSNKKAFKNSKIVTQDFSHNALPLYSIMEHSTKKYNKRPMSFEGKKRIDAALGLLKLKQLVKRVDLVQSLANSSQVYEVKIDMVKRISDIVKFILKN